MSKFSDLLFRIPEGVNVKLARTESPDELQFEKDFSRLAYAFVKDKATPLLPFMVGFEIVDRAEDGTRAVGLFGFTVHDKFYYVPAFFLNNQIKGMDILFSKDDNRMMPLTEEYVQEVLDTAPLVLGEKGQASDRKDFVSPDFRFLTIPPQMRRLGKSASAKDVVANAYAAWNLMRNKVSELLHKDAEFQEMLIGVAGAALGEAVPYGRTSRIVGFLEKKGGPLATTDLLNTIVKSPSYMKAASVFYRLPDDFNIRTYAAVLKPKQASTSKITIIHADNSGCCPCEGSSDSEKKTLVRDGFVIRDSREEAEKSELYDVDYVKRFSTPNESGIYDVILSGGRLAECYVLKGGGAMLVVNPPNGAYAVRQSNSDYAGGGINSSRRSRQVYARDEKREPGSKIYEKAISLDDAKVDTTYAVVNPNGDFCCIFHIGTILAESGKPIEYSGYCREKSLRTDEWIDRIVRSDRPGHSYFIGSDGKLILGKDWKLLPLCKEYKVNENMCLGTIDDLLRELDKKANVKEMVVYGEDMEDPKFRISLDGTMESVQRSYKSACIRLVASYGLGVEDAENLLKEARSSRKARTMVKLAQVPESQLPGVTMPQPPEPLTGFDEYVGIPVEYANSRGYVVAGQTVGKEPRQNPMQPGINMYVPPGGGNGIPQDAQQLAGQAAQSGQKQVFDHATVGGLAKIYDVGGIVDQYIPSMVDTLDKLGRIVFLFYWKNEEFSERYGDDNLQEMEDLMGSTFKQLGEFVLQLKRKSINTDASIV